MLKISVVVCTYNRMESLKNTLDALSALEISNGFDYEAVIVDNNSKDDTRAVVESYQEKFNGRLKYCFEAQQGLCFARNCGIQHSSGDIIAFTDDDCLPPADWLVKIHDVFSRSPEISGVLGNAVWEDGKPMYANDSILRGNGLNMSFRRSLFDEVGLFDVYLGSGALGCSADDVEFIYRAAYRHKKNIVLREEIIVMHKHRISRDEQLKIFHRDSMGHMVFLLKYIFRAFDISSLKRMLEILRFNISSLRQAKKSGDADRVIERKVRLSGTFSGIVRGFKIWLVLSPLNYVAGNKNFTSKL